MGKPTNGGTGQNPPNGSPAGRLVDTGGGGGVRRVSLFIRRVPSVGVLTDKHG